MKSRHVVSLVTVGLFIWGILAVTEVRANGDDPSIAELKELIRQQQQQLEALQQRVEQMEAQAAPLPAAAALPSATPKMISSGLDNISLAISGQVNRGVLFTDDGENTDTFFVDNDNSGTRIRFIGTGIVNDDVTLGTNIEVQFESNSTADVNQNNKRGAGPDNFTQRKLELFVDSKQLGRVWLGQGDTSSNGSSEEDLSGTGIVGYSGVADLAGGLLFRNDDDEMLSDIAIGDVFSNFDGLSRDDRIRYDTPSFNGFRASTSFIADDRWDIALRYGGDFGPVKTAAAIAYADPQSTSTDYRLNGSVSALHESGFNVTAAAGQDEADDSGRDDPWFWYVKVGYIAKLVNWGDTAFAVDYYDGENIGIDDDESRSYGAFVVQNLADYGTEFYLGVRNYEYEQPDADFDDIAAALIGARIKF